MAPKKSPSADLDAQRPVIFAFSLVVTMLMVIVAFEWQTPMQRAMNKPTVSLTELNESFTIPPTHQPPPPKPIVAAPIINEVPDEEIIKEEVNFTLDQEILAEVLTDKISITPVVQEEEETNEIFLAVESPPEFPGGYEAMVEYFQANLKYPYKARRMGIEGKVFIKAVIEKDGSLTHVAVMKGIDTECDREAQRLITNMPKWIPGKQRGRPVRVSITFPITFKL